MKKLILSICAIILNVIPLFAQIPLETAKKDFTYSFVMSGGTNASTVAWHPGLNLYFTVIAGNNEFPLEAFDGDGTNKYSAMANADVRGMWYNSQTKSLEVNYAGELGWAKVSVSKNLTGHNVTVIHEGQFQPDFQSVGTFDDLAKSVAFLNIAEGTIDLYNAKKPEKINSISLKFNSASTEDFNQTTLGYTGVKGYEYVLLNVTDRSLIYFNRKGTEAGRTDLPDDAILSDFFKFSYARNRAFLYDSESRIWTAYKAF